MADCLYQCLKEARLEKYFRNFVNGGLQHCESLLQLSMQEYPRYGVVLMEDRLRLFKLIQIVKSVQADGMVCKHGNNHHGHHTKQSDLGRTNSGTVVMNNRNAAPADNILRPLPLQVQQVHTSQSHIGAPQRAAKKPPGQVTYKGSGDSPVFNCRKTLKFSDSDSETDSEDSVSVQLWDTHNNEKKAQKQSHSENNNSVPLSNNINDASNANVPSYNDAVLSNNGYIKNQVTVSGLQTSESVFLKGCEPNTKISNGEHSDQLQGNNGPLDTMDRGVSYNPFKDEQFQQTENVKNTRDITESNSGVISSVNKHNIGFNSHIVQGMTSTVVSTSSSVTNSKPVSQAFFVSTSPPENSAIVKSQGHNCQGKTSEYAASVSSSSSRNTHSNRGPAVSTTVNSSTQNTHIERSQSHMIEQGVMYRPMSNDDQRHVAQSQPKPFHFKNFHPSSGISGGQHSYFPTTTNQGGPSSSSSSTSAQKATHVEKVYHNCGYTYGVPSNPTSTTPSEQKQSTVKPGQDKIRVCVRKRPLLEREAKRGEMDIIKPQGQNSVIVEESKMTVNLSKYLQQHMFKFDEVFGESCDNQAVYDQTVKPLIQFVFNRGSATCFAFGQTGSGKSYTLLGNKGVAGLYQLAATDIFSCIDTLKSSPSTASHMHLWASYYEIYCSQLFDLLNKRKRLHVRENNRHKVCIVGLMETEVHNVKGLVEVVQYGNASRSTGVSGNNSQSSRSHAVLQLEIRDAKDCKVGRLSFIDLAGSERATDMTDSSDRQTRIEGAEINQSLLALKECIRSLDQENGHTPYRQSKLTHILRDSFIGNSHTVMIANVSPCMSSSVHTLNTLKYADRVKELKKDQEWKLNVARNNKNKPATPKSKQGHHTSKTPSSGKGTQSNSIQRSASLNRHLVATSSTGKPNVARKTSGDAAIVNQTENKNQTPDKVSTPALFMGTGMQFASTPKSKESPSEGPNEGSPFDVSKILREESDTPIRGHKLSRQAKDQRSTFDLVRPTKLDFDNITDDFEVLEGLTSNQKVVQEGDKKVETNDIQENIVNNNNQHNGETSGSHKIYIGAEKVNELIRIQKEKLSVGNEDLAGPSGRSRSRVKPDGRNDRSPPAQGRSKSSGRVLECKRPQESVERRSKSTEKGLSGRNGMWAGTPEGRNEEVSAKNTTKTADTQEAHCNSVPRSRASEYSISRSKSSERLVVGNYPIKSHDEIMAEHREVLDHLDSLLDRAKAAITNSPTSSPTRRKSELHKQCSVESTDSRHSETTQSADNHKPLVSILKKTPTSDGVSGSLGAFLSKSAGKEKTTLELNEEDCMGMLCTRHSDPLTKERYYGGKSAQNYSSGKTESISERIFPQHQPYVSSSRGMYDINDEVIVLDDSSEGKRMDSPCIRPSNNKVFPVSNIASEKHDFVPSEKHDFGPSERESIESSSRPDQVLQRSNSHGSDKESERSNSRNMSWHDIFSQSHPEPKSKENSFNNEKPHKTTSRANSRDISLELHEERRGVTTKAMIKDLDTIVIETDIPPLPVAIPETGRSTGDSGLGTSRSRDPDKFGHSLGSHRSTDNQSDTDTLDDVVSLSSAAVVSSQETGNSRAGLSQEKYPLSKQGGLYTSGTSSDRHSIAKTTASRDHLNGENLAHDPKSNYNIIPPLKLSFGEDTEQEPNVRYNHSARTVSDKKVYSEYNQIEEESKASSSRGVQSARKWTDQHKSALHIHQDSAFTALPENRDLQTKKLIAKPQVFEFPPAHQTIVVPVANSVPNKVKAEGGAEFSPIEPFPITPRGEHVITVPAIVSKTVSEKAEENGSNCIGSSPTQGNSGMSSKSDDLKRDSKVMLSSSKKESVSSHTSETAAVKDNIELPLSNGFISSSTLFSSETATKKVRRELFANDAPPTKVTENRNNNALFSNGAASARINNGLFSSGAASVLEVASKTDSNQISNGKTVTSTVTGKTVVRLKTSAVSDRLNEVQKSVRPLEVEGKHRTDELVTASDLNQVPLQSSKVPPSDISGKSLTSMSGSNHSTDVRSQGSLPHYSGMLTNGTQHVLGVETGGHVSNPANESEEDKATEQGDSQRPKPVRQPSVNKIHQAQEKLMMQHEEQLTKMTALCKQEMKLLMASRMTQKGFPEYVRAVEEILSDKGRAILLLKSKIDDYVATVNNE